jgi:hypothetical protein
MHFFFNIIVSGVGLSPLGTAATSGLLYKPQTIDEGDCGAIGGMRIAVSLLWAPWHACTARGVRDEATVGKHVAGK